MNKLIRYSFFFVLLFLSSCSIVNTYTTNQYKIVDIQDYGQFYVIYAKNDGIKYRIVSEKDPYHIPTERYLQLGKKYDLHLHHLYPGYYTCFPIFTYLHGHILDASMGRGMACGLYGTSQLRGLYLSKSKCDSIILPNFQSIQYDCGGL